MNNEPYHCRSCNKPFETFERSANCCLLLSNYGETRIIKGKYFNTYVGDQQKNHVMTIEEMRCSDCKRLIPIRWRVEAVLNNNGTVERARCISCAQRNPEVVNA